MVVGESHGTPSRPILINRIEVGRWLGVLYLGVPHAWTSLLAHGQPLHATHTQHTRQQLDTAFDFERRVKQILVSPAVAYPHKQDFAYCHVILLTENMKMPLLVPYLFPTRVVPEAEGEGAPPPPPSTPRPRKLRNDLRHWLFINSAGARARHSVEGEFHDI